MSEKGKALNAVKDFNIMYESVSKMRDADLDEKMEDMIKEYEAYRESIDEKMYNPALNVAIDVLTQNIGPFFKSIDYHELSEFLNEVNPSLQMLGILTRIYSHVNGLIDDDDKLYDFVDHVVNNMSVENFARACHELKEIVL